MITTSKSANTNKETREKKLLATLFAVAALSLLYFYVMAIIRPSVSPLIGSSGAGISQGDMAISGDTAGTSKHRSESMKMEFDYSEKYIVTEKLNFIYLNAAYQDEIIISKVGSQFNTTNGHVDSLLAKIKDTTTSRKTILLGDNQWEKVEMSNGSDSEVVLFYVKDYFSYQVSTKNTNLLADVESIAKSLKFVE